MLAQRWIVLVTAVLVFFAFSTLARADTLGQNQSFFIDPQYDAQKRAGLTATLRLESGRAYFYVEDSYWNSINQSAKDQTTIQLNALAAEFDNRIYPIETGFLGSEPTPGIDGDPRITVLVTPLIENAGGYFNTGDVYPRSAANPSNEREILYINVKSLADDSRAKIFLTHEFQHLISVNQKEKLRKVSDDTWLNELRSEQAIALLGYNDIFEGSNLESRLRSFLANPSDSLTEWKNLSPDYAQVIMFGEYLAEHWSSRVIAGTLKNDAISITSLEQALAENGFADGFIDVFRHWLAANVVNDTAGPAKFGYVKEGLKNFRISPSRTVSNLDDNGSFLINDSLKDWQPRWYEISNFPSGQNKTLKVQFSSPSLTSFQIAYLILKSDGSKQLLTFEPNSKSDSLFIGGLGGDVSKVIIMPIKRDKIAGFTANETPISLSLVLTRVAGDANVGKSPGPDGIMPKAERPRAEIELAFGTKGRKDKGDAPKAEGVKDKFNIGTGTARPTDFGLKEGDFIRAEGDNDVYIVNNFGYKRLVLNPQICLQYAHLGKRGCFGAVKVVSPTARDAFKTSWFYTNGETGDGKVYFFETVGGDEAVLHHLNISGDDFVRQGGDFNSVFLVNTREQNSYQRGNAFLKL